MTLTGIAKQTRATRLVVSTSVERDTNIMAFRGDANLATLPFLIDMLASVIADYEGAVVLDLAETEFIDTASVHAMGLAAQCLNDNDRSMTVRSPSRLATMLLATFGLADLIEAEATVDL